MKAQRILAALLASGTLLLSACQSIGGPPPGFVPANAPLPPEVERALPADAGISDVVVRDGCYYLLVDGAAWPIPPDGSAPTGPGGQPLCVG